MDNLTEIRELLRAVADGSVSADEAVKKLQIAPYEDLDYAKIDLQRTVRQGMCEVIYGAGKTEEQILGIVRAMHEKETDNILVTRLDPGKAAYLTENGVRLAYHEIPRLGIAYPREHAQRGCVVVACAGTSDLPVAEEAALTAEVMGSRVVRLTDVGVSGLHRLLSRMDTLAEARCVVAVAGMEGALASVIGGLVSCPVIAVPTSVGYGANFGGLSALLGMLNSCASGCSVVNIDNGFGAGYQASMINLMEGIKEQ